MKNRTIRFIVYFLVAWVALIGFDYVLGIPISLTSAIRNAIGPLIGIILVAFLDKKRISKKPR